MTVAGARLVRGCFKAAHGVRTSMNVRRTRRCATTAHVVIQMTVTRVTVMTVTLDRRAVSGVVR